MSAAPVPVITIHDPTGDVPFPQGDLTGAGFGQNASQLVFAVTVNAPTDPKTDVNWQTGLGFVGWALDTNNDGIPEFVVLMIADPAGHLLPQLFPFPGGAGGCAGTGSYVAGVGFRAVFARTCLPRALTFRLQVAMGYTNDPNDANPPMDLAPDSGWSAAIVVAQAAGTSGYWMLGSDGHVYPFGGAIGFAGVHAGATAMAPRRDGKGYWIVDYLGHVFAYGTAQSHGGSPPLGSREYIRTISSTPSGNGYWLFSNLGRAFPFGDASNYGDMSGVHLNGPIIASVATASGHGYYMVGSDGGIFGFGDAKFHGSMGSTHLNKPIVGIAPTPDNRGYWLAGADGGIFGFNAPFRGSLGNLKLNKPVNGIVAYGNGYIMVASDGGIFSFSNKTFAGSLAAHPPAAPIIGLAAFAA